MTHRGPCALARALSICLALAPVASMAQSESPLIDTGTVARDVEKMDIEMENFVLPGLVGDAPAWQRRLDDILYDDLDFSDLFNVNRCFRFSGQPASPKAKALVRGVVEKQGGAWLLRGRVESFPGQPLVFQSEYPFSQLTARDAVHRFADDIVANLTGQVGISRTKLVFAKASGPVKELWIVDIDGENLRQLTYDGDLAIMADVDRRGRRVAYTTYRRGRPEIGLIDLAGGGERILTLGTSSYSSPAFSPDGTRLAFSGSVAGEADIFLANADGSTVRQLTRGVGIDTSPTWSPDGRHIAFVSDRTGTPQVYRMTADGRDVTRLTLTGRYNAAPAWSPDGDRIAFVSRDGNIHNLYIMPADGSRLEPIVFANGDCESPSWAPDSRHIVYSALRGDERRLYVVDVDTFRDRILTTGPGDCYGPAWISAPER